jgi:hypothetical protein
MTKVIQKKDRVKETINATLTDIQNLYVVAILDKIKLHFEKKLFDKEKEFQKEAHEVRQKHLESVKCDFFWDSNIDPNVKTVDGITVALVKVLKSIGDREVTDQDKLIQKLCFKYDKHREFKIIPVFEKIVGDFWLYG